MINLLPSNESENILYARRNTRLIKWLVVVCLSILGVGVIVGAGHVIINRTANQVRAQVAAGQENLKAQKLEETQDHVEDISASLKLVTQVLSKQIILSELIPQIGTALPSGTALTALQLNKLEGGIDLTVAAVDYQTATQVQVNLQDPANKIFQKADINSINCAAVSDDPRYPCQITLRALFVDDNPYSLINQSGAEQ